MIFLVLALYLKYKKNMSLRLQILRMKVRVKKSIVNLQNKEKVDNILERVRQKKAKKIGTDISQEQLIPKKSVTENFKAALKSKIQKNRIVQKIKEFYTKYKDKYLNKSKEISENNTQKTMSFTKNMNINPALLKKASASINSEIPNKAIKNKLANIMREQRSQMKQINKQTYCHDENKHPQSQNNQML